jgi:hypothetical protein
MDFPAPVRRIKPQACVQYISTWLLPYTYSSNIDPPLIVYKFKENIHIFILNDFATEKLGSPVIILHIFI